MLSNIGRKLAASAVHLYTAAGGVVAFFALVEIAYDRPERALLLLGIAFVIDATDGYWARRLRVAEVLPTINGEILDLVIDFITYAVAPLFLLWRTKLLPEPHGFWAVLILIAAHYDFANRHPLKHHGLYTGLPAMWNLYAFHVFYLHPPKSAQMLAISTLFVLTFAPIHFVYPSRLDYLRTWHVVAVSCYIASYLAVMLHLVDEPAVWATRSLAYPIWYLGSSFWVHIRVRKGMLPLRLDTQSMPGESS